MAYSFTNKGKINNKSKINAFIMASDPLNHFQNASPIDQLPDVDGKRIKVNPTDWPSLYNGHSIDTMLKAFGVNPSQFQIIKPENPVSFEERKARAKKYAENNFWYQ
jgi:hypothetical protein